MNRKTDWLRELRGVLLAAAILSAAYTALSAGLTISGAAFSVGVPAGTVLPKEVLDGTTLGGTTLDGDPADGDAADGDPAEGVTIDPDQAVHLRVSTPDAGQRWLATLATAPTYGLVTAILILLWRLVHQAIAAQPFTAGTARRLHLIAWLAIIAGPAAYAIGFIAHFVLSASLTGTAVSVVALGGATTTLGDLAWPVSWVLAGFGFLAVAEIIRRGQALRAELDEVV